MAIIVISVFPSRWDKAMSAQFTLKGPLVAAREPVVPGRPGWLRRTWFRSLRTVQEMNYANRRLVEVQAPWIADQEWHRR
jgi:hypothetical protein